jgi:hypothetical protein
LVGCQLVLAPAAAADPAGFAHGSVDQRFTTTRPGAATGFGFTGVYHAAGDAAADPPYMRRMIFENPGGLRYDTSVPDRCTASDAELEARGPAACPAGSLVARGTTDTRFLGRFPSTVEVFTFNNAGEQIMVAHSPQVWSVARGRIRPDSSVEFASPTCWPTLGPTGCPIDDVLQLRTAVTGPPITRSTGSYLTTPPTCPPAGHWETPIRFWWGDGSVDTVVTRQPCAPDQSL